MAGVEKGLVRAIDVGFCNTKFIMSSNSNGDMSCGIFPSLSPMATDGKLDGLDMMRKNVNITVEVNGKIFEVGKDVDLAIGSNYGRTLDNSFSTSDSYMALVRGALYSMGVDNLEMLVLGLPVSVHKEYSGNLEKIMAGVHDVSNRKILVKKCKVIPQPVGGFFEYASKSKNYEKLKSETNLIIDVGFYTLDWLMTNKMKPVYARSGAANNGGMGSVISNVAMAISKKNKIEIEQSLYGRIDDALRSPDKKVKFYSKEYDLNEYIKFGEAAALEAINKMFAHVGNGSDIDNIVVVGGGGWFYKKLIQNKFPNHEINIAENANFSNVKGFQIFGLELVSRNQ